MYQWLIDEINLVKAPYFHVIGPHVDKRDAGYIRKSPLQVPDVYKEFVITFTFARLFRTPLDNYRILIGSEPVYWPDTKYGGLYCIGKYEMGTVYFKESELDKGKDIPVHEWYGMSGIRKAADTFDEWIHVKYRNARKKYKVKEWKALLIPPPPFTEHEQAIVAARHQMKWEMVRIEENFDRVVRITNMSNMVLPYFTLDINHSEGRSFTRSAIPTNDLMPGETKEHHVKWQVKYPEHEQLLLAGARDPVPGEQQYYWEFR